MSEHVLVLNCGSSSIKFALYQRDRIPSQRTPDWGGQVSAIGTPQAALTVKGGIRVALALSCEQPGHAALLAVLEQVWAYLGDASLVAVVHRVVHGGVKYFDPVRVDASVLEDLRSYIPLAPLHQPFALDAIEALLADHPQLVQIACFDTGFHRDIAPVEQMLALPYAAWERGIRRYGFHGLSYQYLSMAVPERIGPLARQRMLAAHLGSGASLCAMKDLKSYATTMGFSALDGLMMGTRCGAIDPGAVIYLMEIEKLTLQQVAHLLYYESGLLGVSGVSADPSVLLPLEDRSDAVGERVRAALALYVHRIVREAGALIALLGGVDVLVFTAGIGEHSAPLRARVCAALGWLDVEIDAELNAQNAAVISTPGSAVLVVVEPTNEEWVAALQAHEML
ncbi:acetate kinase [Herbaspirillum sp. Sphag1AN]|uniref:acetate/propionate family kinase n=1 Tax=unclassified Herbaspirillum TaxID=2624150 RepID=UPI00161DDEC2|nr:MULTISPECIES: acetate/propionate family kinase [unclassified Herbaspirillum]MBB3212186.1 acetate kinase [Herbaspirillum sp. Sphag1AN]MBB3243980.1 acetate kinase [Herbaspirillum sp. Sphag64]